MKKCTIDDLTDISGKKILVRVDFNVPMQDGQISDDTRIKAALPTLRYLSGKGAKLILTSHLGQPKVPTPSLSLKPVSQRLSQLLNVPVSFSDDCVGESSKQAVAKLNNGDIVMLENVRFYSEETKNDSQFSAQLASLADIYVNDAFGAAHRAHASTVGVARYLPAYAGFLMKKELEFLDHSIQHPKRPFLAIIGGSKVSSKLAVLKHLLGKVDTLVIGGAMAYTFFKAKGYPVGKSLWEADQVEEAKAFLQEASNNSTRVILPVDHVVVETFSNEASQRVLPVDQIAELEIGVDVGPQTVALIQDEVKKAQTIFWNGPLGVFEMPAFAKGSFSVARALADSSAITIIGGGDSASAIAQAGLSDKMTHISTGGGASLEFMEGRILPGVAALKDR